MQAERTGTVVFLTGATGFIGGRLAAALSARGHRLRCLVRNPDRAGALRALGAELVVGDVSDADAMARGAAGAGLAYHVAAVYDIGVHVDVRAMERTNVEGTRVFVEAVAAAGVPRSVYVSSTVALGPEADGPGRGSSQWTGPYPSAYHRTKTLAHHVALGAVAEGLPLVIACPAYVYGPGDEGPPMHFIFDILRHRLPGLARRPTVFSYVHVDDVVAGLVAAGERGVAGAVYVLGGVEADVNTVGRLVAQLADTWISPLRFPLFAVRLTGSLFDVVSRVTGVRLPISRELAEVGGTGARWVHSSARAQRELGYSWRTLEEGLPETVADARRRLGRQGEGR